MALSLIVLLACGSQPAQSPRAHVITGVATEIESGQGFGTVESFTVKQGQRLFLVYIDDEATYDFPLAHLNSHRAGADPVRVEAEAHGDKLIAISISDA